jgi:hypothetical protein
MFSRGVGDAAVDLVSLSREFLPRGLLHGAQVGTDHATKAQIATRLVVFMFGIEEPMMGE